MKILPCILLTWTSRIAMFLTDNYSIREVLAFPFMKEKQGANKGKLAAELAGVQPLPEDGIGKYFSAN